MPEVRPFPFDRLPRIPRADAISLRRAARRLPLGAVLRAAESAHSWLGAPLAIEALPLERCPRGELALCLGDPLCAAILEPASPIGARVALEIEPRLASILIDRVLGGSGDDAPLAPGALGDVERGVLAYAVARLLAHTQGALRVVSIVTTPAAFVHALGEGDALCWPARASVGDAAGIVRAWIPGGTLDRAEPSPIPAPHAASLAALEVEVTLECGRGSLPARELVGLAPGDVVVLDEVRARRVEGVLRGEVRARIARGRASWACAVEGADLIVRAIEPGGASSSGMSASEEARMDDGTQGTEALLRAAGDAPVDVVVELARVALPLGELAALRPGEVLITGRSLGERVTLRVGERILAQGELVDVEGEIGVRILSI